MEETPCAHGRFLALPAEVRIAILEYVFEDSLHGDGFKNHGLSGGIILDDEYGANACLQPLFTCRQVHEDGNLLALKKTCFVSSSLFISNNIPERLSILQPKQIEAIRSITFVADARHFHKLVDWDGYPFAMSNLRLDTLTVVLHRSSFWHYLFDFTSGIAQLLRTLNGVKRFVFVRNNALVKGNFRTWFNRLIGLIMKIDHYERYDRCPANPEKVWWRWSYDDVAQSFCMEALPAKETVDEETYMQNMKPLLEQLRVSMENEEWNPDPRSRNGF